MSIFSLLRLPRRILIIGLMAMATQVSGYGFGLKDLAYKAFSQFEPHTSTKTDSHKSYGGSDNTAAPDLPAATGNFGACQNLFPNGEPPVVPNPTNVSERALCFNGYAVLHSGATKTPVFSAEVLNRSSLQAAKNEKRHDQFFADARLPARERASLDDYRGSTFDRGHQSPAGDRNNSDSMAQSFSLANMTPQSPEMNRKAWNQVEQATRKYALRASGNVYVITGPVFERGACPFVLAARRSLESRGANIPAGNGAIVAQAKAPGFVAPKHYDAEKCTIGNGVGVPSHLYKVVYDASTHRAWAHWLANTDWAQISKPISYQELVAKTGIKFFLSADL